MARLDADALLSTMSADTGEPIAELRIDGGATANNQLMQFQADISAIKIIRTANLESTALGAAYLAGIATGFWSLEDITLKGKIDHEFNGTLLPDKISMLKQQWLKAVKRSMHWVE
ncbi:FGGY-family carbohydrate kinase [Bathymodiolus japonicus methanotrophic gill symbiont]|uniref:FGGY-family carbohydrate kinase n=1 Tax=Bathymodiolus japonicus methanotrophic gill symbiont TaxID=113269 RepID=UPI001C8E72C9|nr:FGGY-family carbohydrate kinase [Bathymodiolus japonicus methanotrophic gill symbiont]